MSKFNSSCVQRFVASRRGTAGTMMAVAATLMSLLGVAFLGDHVYLVHQRDTLRVAADAAGLAAALYMGKLDSGLSDDDMKAALMPTAKRYILANLPEKWRAKVAEPGNLTVELTLDRAAGTVDVSIDAILTDGAVFGTGFGGLGWSGAAQRTQVRTGSERTDSITEVALVIDMTRSMSSDLDGNKEGDDAYSGPKLTIVKEAAKNLVDILGPVKDGSIAIGLVPWGHIVKVNKETAKRWKDKKWVVYPTEQYYPNPYHGSTDGETHALPSDPPEEWWGCLDFRPLCPSHPTTDPFIGCPDSDPNPPGFSTALPTDTSLRMLFYPARTSYQKNRTGAYRCYGGSTYQSWCFEGTAEDEYNPENYTKPEQGGYYYVALPQQGCWEWEHGAAIEPLTTDPAEIKTAITNLTIQGSTTYSTVGLIWGHRMLAPEWRDIWGGAVHPADHAAGTRKALVLLSDGEDNYVSKAEEHRSRACTAAKDDGITVFTIMATKNPSQSLKDCASKPEYSISSTATADDLKAAFSTIARRLVSFRRTY